MEIFITIIAIIIIFITIFVYITKIRITDVAEFVNEENKYKVIFQAVGEPEFPFGRTKVKVTLINDDNKKVKSFEVRYEDENIWLTQKMLAALYDVDVRTINYHIKKIFKDGELQEDAVIRKIRITAEDRKSYNTKHYSLEMVIAVGYIITSVKPCVAKSCKGICV